MAETRLHGVLTPATVVRVPERGQVEVPRDTWKALAADPEFWGLVDARFVKVLQPGARRVALAGTSYIGRAVFGNVILELVEKIPGAAAAVLRFATRGAFEIRPMATPTTELGNLMGLLVAQFLVTVREYVSRGRTVRYAFRSGKGSLIRGRIDMTRTIRLRARGARHLAAFEYPTLEFAVDKNRVIAAALREVERLAGVVTIEADDLSRSRTLAALFADCVDAETVFAPRRQLAGLADRLSRSDERDGDMLSLAAVLLSNESFELKGPVRGVAPRSWFINLETLFETAVRRLLGEIAVPDVSVAKESRRAPAIFRQGEAAHTANPDLVLRSEAGVLAVGDVKYKQWSGAADVADLYQLLVHTAAFGGPTSFLVYPDDRYASVHVGQAVTGPETYLFAVDVRNLAGDLTTLLTKIGVAVRPALLAPTGGTAVGAETPAAPA